MAKEVLLLDDNRLPCVKIELIEENETEIELEFDKQAQEAACISKPETFTYHDIRISIEYDKESCMIHLNNKQVQLSYSILDESINDLVYISVK